MEELESQVRSWPVAGLVSFTLAVVQTLKLNSDLRVVMHRDGVMFTVSKQYSIDILLI